MTDDRFDRCQWWQMTDYKICHIDMGVYGSVWMSGIELWTMFYYLILLRHLSTCNVDVHWRPFITRCGFCTIPYTVVGRLESIQQDLYYIGGMAGVQFGHYSSNPSSGGSSNQLAKKYFSELDKRTIRQLYEIYKVDFEMFGYHPNSLQIVME